MWPNPQFPADLVNLPKKSLMENFIFCAEQVSCDNISNDNSWKLF